MNDENRRRVILESIKMSKDMNRIKAESDRILDEINRLSALRGRIETPALSEAWESALNRHLEIGADLNRTLVSNCELLTRYVEAFYLDLQSMGVPLTELGREVWPDTIDRQALKD